MDYVKVASEAGAEVFGVSDHMPIEDGRWPSVRMKMNELDDYDAAVRHAQNSFPGMKILLGLECEYVEQYQAFYEDELLGKRNYDYLIGAGHFTPHQGNWFNSFMDTNTADHLLAYSSYLQVIMETGLFAFIAHPDIFGGCNDRWNDDLTACSKDILAAAEEMDIPLKINGLGFRKPEMQTSLGKRNQYPWLPFWEIASDYNIRVVCNSDAHQPKHALANLDDTIAIAEKYSLEIADLSHLG